MEEVTDRSEIGEVTDRSPHTVCRSIDRGAQPRVFIQKAFVLFITSVAINAINITETLLNLTKVTRERLHDVERQLEVLWVAAQQVDARQKVEISIR